jgi:hypothetical protein
MRSMIDTMRWSAPGSTCMPVPPLQIDLLLPGKRAAAMLPTDGRRASRTPRPCAGELPRRTTVLRRASPCSPPCSALCAGTPAGLHQHHHVLPGRREEGSRDRPRFSFPRLCRDVRIGVKRKNLAPPRRPTISTPLDISIASSPHRCVGAPADAIANPPELCRRVGAPADVITNPLGSDSAPCRTACC